MFHFMKRGSGSAISDHLAVYESDEDVVTRWIKQYGRFTLVTFLLVFGLTVSWEYWQARQLHHREQAALLYERALDVLTPNASDEAAPLPESAVRTATQSATLLQTEYADTPYAILMTFWLAKQAVIARRYPRALSELQFVVSHTHRPQWRDLARIRMARVWLAYGDPGKSLAVLDQVQLPAFKQSLYYFMRAQALAKQATPSVMQAEGKAQAEGVTSVAVQMKRATQAWKTALSMASDTPLVQAFIRAYPPVDLVQHPLPVQQDSAPNK